MNLSSVNFISVIVATVVTFALGAVWYNEAVFGGIFMEVMGITEQDATASKLAVEFVKQFLVCLVVAALAAGLKLKTVSDAFRLSVLIGIVVVAIIVSQHHWGDMPKAATVIDVGHAYVSVLIYSLFGCLWGKKA